MHIVFLLPGHGRKPIGGHKIVYQYANKFIDDGYEVSIVYGSSGLFEKDGLRAKLKSILRFLYFKVLGNYKPIKWFNLNPKIKTYFNWDITEGSVPQADKYISTSIETAYRLQNFKKKIGNYYFIQDFESWKWGDSMVVESLAFNLYKIAISNWLVSKIMNVGQKADLVENGFDFDSFNLDIPIIEKNNHKIIMLFHTGTHKGTNLGFKALEIVKKKYPSLRVTLFGTFPKPDNLPNWYDYYQSPSKDKLRFLYNEAAIFLGTSKEEGWGLTLGESMQCGCAVVCTDNKGYQSMAIDGVTALVSPYGHADIMAKNIITLIEKEGLRIRLAEEGYEHIKKFTIQGAYEKFKKIIISND